MNIIDSVIIGVALISVLIVVMVITRSFKSVDKEIVQNIQNGDFNKKKKFFTKIKQAIISFVEWFIRKIRKGMQKIHFWAIRAKKRSKSDIIKAKDELVIKERIEPSPKKIDTKKNNKQINKMSDKNNILEEISLQGDDTIMDSATRGGENNEEVHKRSFIKGLFKGRLEKRKDVDIKNVRNSSSEEWSLGGSINSEDKGISSSDANNNLTIDETEDVVLGVDRKILEKKILQKINKNPKRIDNYHELGELYIKMKKYNDAMEVFGYILDISPNDLEAKHRQDKIKLLKNGE